ncbi:uncharacterized protein LOC104887052 isoform X3 [Beta vulgaris subsp. vulgaris]|uniref:uncharacterized protein LOC104887052 isoform X3 n=1 Tax=Beta vulgaris subsp. vulgaris TaxID=3555 RepID=UPI002036A5EC|nr:uncharacterized protein LOC104887052 isoform X3 [Beta vulgaris subsp. vulgaris]XP_048494721.1 uncharacterized protein LOC104887052 isoform X3 [Beta vulgaris subsp. vulgaris]
MGEHLPQPGSLGILSALIVLPTCYLRDLRYGLASVVFSKDLERCERVSKLFESGAVWVNCSQPCFVHAPWGGIKSSGFGCELGEWSVHSNYSHPYTQLQVATTLNLFLITTLLHLRDCIKNLTGDSSV